ncbi:MAG: hypothetical protein Q9195_005172 [Heterodermia aff. obscurata]
MWESAIPYQTPLQGQLTPASTKLDLKDPVIFDQYLGKGEYYADFLRFFEDEVTEKGVPSVIKEYILKGDERADDIFCRMYADLVHPMIHLGCAIEFHQPSLVAEALAEACVHENWPKHFLLPTEEYVRSNKELPSKPLYQIIDSLHNDPEIASGVKDTDPFNKIPDGFLKRVTTEQLMPYLSQFQVRPEPEDLQRKMTDMMHTCAYMIGAAQRPGKREAIDFVLLHCATLSVFYPAILAQDWLSNHDKSRLLEAKARVDAVIYAGCGSPTLYHTRIVDYVPRHPADGWAELFHRSIVYNDEGHVVKLIRALFSIEQLGETEPGFPIGKRDVIKIAHIAMDSVERAFEAGGSKLSEEVAEAVIKRVGNGGEVVKNNMTRWVFYGGLEKAWDYVPDSELLASEAQPVTKVT